MTNVGYTAAFVQSGNEIQLHVTGFAAGQTVDWTARVDYLGSV